MEAVIHLQPSRLPADTFLMPPFSRERKEMDLYPQLFRQLRLCIICSQPRYRRVLFLFSKAGYNNSETFSSFFSMISFFITCAPRFSFFSSAYD